MTPSIRIEGGLFSSDLLEQLDRNDLPGQRAADFGLSGSLSDEVAAVFSEARALWDMFQQRLQRLGDQSSPAQITRVTRNQWHIPFFSLLGYDLQPNAEPLLIGNVAFPISHRAGPNPDAPPVHLVAKTQVLGAIDQTTRPRRSPHALLQQYLNQSDALWGIVTNGAVVRLLRNSTLISRQSYLEIDLEAIFTDNRFDDFLRAYRLLHRSRLPQGHADAERCLLEQYYRTAIEQGGRVRERLREGVEQAITTLASGFLATGYQPPSALQFYRDLLRLVYRMLFLLVAEHRGLFGTTDLYRDHYSISRLVHLSSERNAYTDDVDLWHSVRALWYVLRDEKLAEKLGVAPLNGDLFTELPLDHCRLRNRDLLHAIWRLAWYRPTEREQPRRVNYAALDTEELGSVYESLLDYHPVITGGTFTLSLGSERKTTGSYYTPPQLVQELVTSTLKPVLAERLQAARTQEAKIAALLNLKVLDPACGSGHFLLAAARYLGRELARLRSQEDEPSPDAVRQSVREVIAHCIYGVDKNPLAVELARVALWIESHDVDKPLTFLDHRIKCGDSLVGILNLDVLKTGIPDDTFAPLSTDDKEIANSLKKRNRSECRSLASGQMRLPFAPAQVVAALGSKHHDIEAIADDSPAAVREKKNRYERLLADPKRLRLIEACDLWTAAFFQRFTPELLKSHAAITTDVVTDHLAELAHPQALAAAQALAVENRFFHWPLEFPEVFHPSPHRSGGESTPPSPHAGGVRFLPPLPKPWERGGGGVRAASMSSSAIHPGNASSCRKKSSLPAAIPPLLGLRMPPPVNG
ncbi:DNA methyltransferase [Synechococcus sp. W60.3]|uniref:DNA methyltransferase n=1 Tax=Synechococcus sp. W60.3 TaxID=2967125 RepID=UPI0039C7192D